MENKHAERIKSLVNSADAAGWVQLSPRDVAAIGALIHDAEAAPDLLAALEELVAEFDAMNADRDPARDGQFLDTGGMGMARAAIARARGE